MATAQQFQAIEPLHVGDIEVEQHQVEIGLFLQRRQRFLQAGRLENLAAVETDRDHAAQPVAHQRVVVDDQHPFHHRITVFDLHVRPLAMMMDHRRGRGKLPAISAVHMLSAPHDDHRPRLLIWPA